MSDFVDICDEIATDLTASGRPLEGATVHKYAAWSPEHFEIDGARHVAVYPTGDRRPAEEQAGGHAIGYFQLDQYIEVLVWEPAPVPAERRVEDETQDKAFVNLQEAVRNRFLTASIQGVGGAWKCEYQSADFPSRTGAARSFRLLVKCSLSVNAYA